MGSQRHNLLGMDLDELSAFAETIGEHRYHGRQIYHWLYAKSASTFGGMTDLGKDVRERLELSACIEGLQPVMQQASTHDGTVKFLFRLSSGLEIESVLIPPKSAFAGGNAAGEDEQRRLTLCVSTQVGCPLACAFCATGSMGFFRNLTAGEMIDQVRQVQKATGKRITNIVFMGMGEPMLNYEAVLKCAGIMASGLGIAARHITVSTAGWVDGIRRMGDDRRREKLAISLHSAVDQTRAKLMPIASRFPLDALMSAVEYYYRQTGQRVTYEFIFFEGINDTPQEVSSLVRLARRVPCKINVIPFHSIAFTEGAGLAKSLRPSPRMQEHVDRLRAAHLTVMVRSSAGEDIDAACGQLAVKIRRAGRRRSDLAHPAPQTI